MATQLTGVYLHVVADVINNVRADFISEGVDEAVLQELQSLWELNMMQAGTIQGVQGDMPYVRSTGGGYPSVTSVHDLNMPYEGETPTAELLFPPTPVHTPLPSFLPPGHIPNVNEHSDTANATDIAIGRPAPFMTAPWMHQKPDVNLGMNAKLDMNVAYDGGEEEEGANGQFPVMKEFLPPSVGKRKRDDSYPSGSYFPQHDGAGDVVTTALPFAQDFCNDEAQKPLHMETLTDLDVERSSKTKINFCKHVEDRKLSTAGCTAVHSLFPQLDGIDDNYDDGVAEEDYNDPGEEEHVAPENINLELSKVEGGESDGSEPPLNEEDDLNDLDDIDDADEEELQTDNVVYAQFEKVTRAKNKWKCILKDGIMHLNGRDYLFSKANGEFEF